MLDYAIQVVRISVVSVEDFFFSSDIIYIYVCCVYFSHRNSSYTANSDTDLFEYVEKSGVDMSQLSKHGKLIICGDVNIKTGCNKPDFILNIEPSYIPLSTNKDSYLKCRISQDHVIYSRGRELLDFCINRNKPRVSDCLIIYSLQH